MVHQATNNVVDVKVCSISFQRHCTSLLNQQKNQRHFQGHGHRFNPRAIMADSQSKQQQLPVVELRPFVKKVWRREKSLPDFYERKTMEETASNSNSKGSSLEVSPSTSRLVRELTETRKSMETRQNTMDGSFGKYRSHPKAEFSHESNKSWRKQDFIPGFITRFERTRTSMDVLSKESTSLHHRYNLHSSGVWDGDESPPPTSTTIGGIRGGKMNQNIHRRHLLYLNPLDTYRQPTSWNGQFNSSDNSRHSTGRLIPSRNSFPMSSGRARELMLSGSQFNHCLKPIQREDAESPHRFNNKLGAAKNSLQILNKLGAPTKLEKTLEKEYQMNLERFRRDRLFLPHDLKALGSNYVPFDSNPTIGETFLRNAREANKPKKRFAHGNDKVLGLVRQDTNGWYSGDTLVPDIQSIDTMLVNQLTRPINTVLHEETEIRLNDENGVNGYHLDTSSQPVGVAKSLPENGVSQRLNSNPVTENDSTDNNAKPVSDLDLDHKEGSPSSNQCQTRIETSLLPGESIASDKNHNSNNDTDNNNNNNNNNNNKNNNSSATPSTNLSPVDSSRLETNIDYLNNLHRKSKSVYFDQTTPSPGITPDTANTAPSAILRQSVAPTTATPTTVHATSNQLETEDAPNTNADGHTQNAQGSAITTPLQSASTPSNMTGGTSMGDSPESNRRESTETFHADGLDTESSPPSHASPNSPQKTAVESVSESAIDSDVSKTPPANLAPMDDLQGAKVAARSHDANHQRNVQEGRNESHKANSVVRSMVLPPLETKQTRVEENQSCHSNTVLVGDKSSNGEPVITARDGECDTEGEPNNLEKTSLVNQEMVASHNPTAVKADHLDSLIPEDEGISMTTAIESAVLDSSMTEATSDQEGVMSGCADNGDSGVSTTFLTADDSRAKELEGLMV